MKTKKNKSTLAFEATMVLGVSFAILMPELAFAAITSGSTIGGIATNVQASLGPIMSLITGGAYVAGAAFGASALLGFKQHAENAQQVPLKQPFTKLGVAAGLSYLGYFIGSGGATMFGTGTAATGITGFQ